MDVEEKVVKLFDGLMTMLDLVGTSSYEETVRAMSDGDKILMMELLMRKHELKFITYLEEKIDD